MLISALCDYYDDLVRDGKVVPDGYSEQAVHYLIALSQEGKIRAINEYYDRQTILTKKGNNKEINKPRIIYLPFREKQTSVKSYLLDHRPRYIFGLNFDNDVFSAEDDKNLAKKSHEVFVQTNLEFINGLNSPIVNAFRNFLYNWVPEKEINNRVLLSYAEKVGKKYNETYLAFCLFDDPNVMLHKDHQVCEKISKQSANSISEHDEKKAICSIMGKNLPIAKTHLDINVSGENTSKGSLVNFNENSSCSYGNKQSYNSNISVLAMKKYTFALNRLLADRQHRTVIDNTTIVYWATGSEQSEQYSNFFDCFINDYDDHGFDKNQMEKVLDDTFKLVKSVEVTQERLSKSMTIDENVDFYIVGLKKTNRSRVAVTFVCRRKYADILYNIAQHQTDIAIIGINRRVSLLLLVKALSPIKKNKQKNDGSSKKKSDSKSDSVLFSSIFKAIIYRSQYPLYLLSKMVTRMKIDKINPKNEKEKEINAVRAGVVKACINRQSRASGQKEELQLALDKQNTNQAYLCGRLFAVLERIQKQALGDLNRSIKDAYFASAASKPSLVFPKLITLSQSHMKKLSESSAVFYNKLMEEIIGKLNGEFPDTLMLKDQGRFMIGYYQQDQAFYQKQTNDNKEEQSL